MFEESLNEPSYNASDNSFVILGPGSFISLANDGNKSEENSIKLSTNIGSPTAERKLSDNGIAQSTCSTASNCFNDTQEKLNQLLRENYQLKETLNQNNLAIKTQLNTFFMWQQEVLKTHETHKQKFLETKDLILKLRAENQNLKMQLENNMEKFFTVNSLKLEKGKFPLTDEISTTMEVEKLKKEVKKFEEMYEDMRKNNEYLKNENNDLQKVIESCKKDISDAHKKLKELEKENEYLKVKNSGVQKESEESYSLIPLPNSEARIQISNLLKQLEEERAKVLKLKQELELTKANSMAATECKNPAEELTQYINQLKDMDASFKKQNQRFNGLSSWISLAEESIIRSEGMLQSGNFPIMTEIAQLKSHLHREENVFKQKEENLQEMHEQFNRLLNDYKDLQLKMNSLESINMDAEKYKKDIESLSVQLKAKDESLKLKDEDLTKLRENVKKLNLECEEVAILRVQTELYQSDFNDERAAREKIAGEKEEMAEQIRLLQSRINDLEREKESKNETDSSESTSQLSQKRKKSPFVCPKCMNNFSDLKECQEHIEDCLINNFDY